VAEIKKFDDGAMGSEIAIGRSSGWKETRNEIDQEREGSTVSSRRNRGGHQQGRDQVWLPVPANWSQ
jgi:hypothetical protein